MDCATACSLCGTNMGSARSFATATTMCWPCYKKQQMVKCDACSHEKESDKFDAHILKNHLHHGRKAVCTQCVECGYSPLDVRSYQCRGRGGHACGHRAFDRVELKNAKTRSMESLMCKACARGTLQCIGCATYLPRSSFDGSMWHNGRHHGRQSICTRCQAVGLSPRDIQRYACSQCGSEYGHMKFEKNALNNLKKTNRTAKLCCQLCTAETTKHSAAAKVRQTHLLSILRQPDADKCTCKRIPHRQKAYHALHRRVHLERCRLYPKMRTRRCGMAKTRA